mgnify:CR=1 FL=1
MALARINCEMLGELDNGVGGLLIDREIDKAVADLEDRGEEDNKIRKVVIQLELQIKDGMVIGHVAVEAKLPPRRSRPTLLTLKVKDGKPGLLFQTQNADNPNQPTFPLLDQETETEDETEHNRGE